MEVKDAPTGWSAMDDEGAPRDNGPSTGIERDDGQGVARALSAHGLRNDVHVLGAFALLSELVKDGRQGFADGVSSDDLGCGGLEGEKRGGVRIEELNEAVDVRVVERGNKGME
jgi:hypothetical protein